MVIGMDEYTICKEANNKEFEAACNKIEKIFPNIEVVSDLMDVDGSQIKTFRKDGKTIKVYNDYEVDAVFIDSEIDISHIFVV